MDQTRRNELLALALSTVSQLEKDMSSVTQNEVEEWYLWSMITNQVALRLKPVPGTLNYDANLKHQANTCCRTNNQLDNPPKDNCENP